MDLITILMLIEAMVLFLLICALVYYMINGAIYFPTKLKNVDIIIRMANIKPNQKVADLGSGDGRILVAFAKHGIEAHGFENNPFLVLWSRKLIEKSGFKNKIYVHYKNFWHADLSSFDIVTVYGIPYIMKRLEQKLKKELKPGAIVISNNFAFSNWQTIEEENMVYKYVI